MEKLKWKKEETRNWWFLNNAHGVTLHIKQAKKNCMWKIDKAINLRTRARQKIVCAFCWSGFCGEKKNYMKIYVI
jgi:hypothetical protein